jgi:hypothetical protein
MLGILTNSQRRQAALRSLIANSLPASNEIGSARRLIEGLPHAGGTIAGVPQAYTVLYNRYHVAEPAADPAKKLAELLQPTWPKELSQEAYQHMLSAKIRQATEVGLNPAGDSDAEVQQRGMWWPLIGSPPPNSLYFVPAEKARMLEPDHETTADRDRFVQYFLTEIGREVDVNMQRRSISQQSRSARAVDANAAFSAACGGCEPWDPFVGGVPTGRSSFFPGCTGTNPSSAAPSGNRRHPCVKCERLDHPRGHKCTAQVTCGACNSTDHLRKFCWIEHGVQLFNRRLPPKVAEAYQNWHQEFKAGTYKPLPGGPPRVRIVYPSRQPSASAAEETSDDAARHNYSDPGRRFIISLLKRPYT